MTAGDIKDSQPVVMQLQCPGNKSILFIRSPVPEITGKLCYIQLMIY
jgi:hypothetical protein